MANTHDNTILVTNVNHINDKSHKKYLFMPKNDEKVRFYRFCSKGKECQRGTECVFAHSYDILNPELCSHERKGGCRKGAGCVFMHMNETKYEYVLRACSEDIKRLGIDMSKIDRKNSQKPRVKRKEMKNSDIEKLGSYREQLKTFILNHKSLWSDMEDDSDVEDIDDYNRRCMYRIWGDGTVQVNDGKGNFTVIEYGTTFQEEEE